MLTWFDPPTLYAQAHKDATLPRKGFDADLYLKLAANLFDEQRNYVINQTADSIACALLGDNPRCEFGVLGDVRVVCDPDPPNPREPDFDHDDVFTDPKSTPCSIYSVRMTRGLAQLISRAYGCDRHHAFISIRTYDDQWKRGELLVEAIIYANFGPYPVFDAAAAHRFAESVKPFEQSSMFALDDGQ